MKLPLVAPAIALAILAAPSSGQVYFGPGVGGSQTNLIGQNSDAFETRPGALGGFLMGGKFNDFLGVQAEVFYLKKGGEDAQEKPDTMMALVDYLEMPLAMRGSLTGTGVELYLLGGPTVAVTLNCDVRIARGAQPGVPPVSLQEDCDAEGGQTLINKMEYTANAALGVTFATLCGQDPNGEVACQGITLEYRYSGGFTEFGKAGSLLEGLKNRTHSFRVSYPFGLKLIK